ncbi:copper chaperone [Mumia quercus]|uniref:copper chaperone n=1 Tax=Mumia quercus TaxID=2976125 RepID=UPI0021CE4B3A|nr:DUF2182 domain-containing protein [Mumia quercus]
MSSVGIVTRTHWYHPEWCAVVLAGADWAVLASTAFADPTHLLGSSHAAAPLHTLAHAVAMSTAMMVPLVLPQVAHVAQVSLWPRRYRAAAGFLAGFVAVWTVVAVGTMLVAALLVQLLGWRPALALGFTFAAVAYALPGRERLVRQCARTMPLAPHGWRADRDCLRYGAGTARRCVVTCWVAMTAVMISQGLVVMALATALGILERRRVRGVAREDAVLVVVGLGLLALGLSYGVGAAGVAPNLPGGSHPGH